MNLADRIVALGIGETNIADWQTSTDDYFLYTPTLKIFSADQFTHSWEVAGALMEKIYEKKYSFLVMQLPDEKSMVTVQEPILTAGQYADPSKRRTWAAQVVDGSLIHAIIQACVEALEE